MQRGVVVILLLATTIKVFAASDADGQANDAMCQGEKGEKGEVGHPGVQGNRGYKGEKGEEGTLGSDGTKGDPGVRGPPGPRGPEGPTGSVGAPGKAGPRGPPGNTGSQGPVGPPGLSGLKGQIGLKGSKGTVGGHGLPGADGKPGPPGHRGPVGVRGFKGVQGERGDPGHKGEQGPQGISGPAIDPQTLKDYFEPVKSLRSQVLSLNTSVSAIAMINERLDALNKTLARLESLQTGLETTSRPAAHLSGSDSGRHSNGHVFQWSTGGFGAFLGNGMKYSSGYITVPRTGLYYVYVQVNCDPDGSSWCGYSIRVNGNSITEQHYNQGAFNQDVLRGQTSESGLLRKLNGGDKLSVTARNSAYYYISNQSFFGGVWLS